MEEISLTKFKNESDEQYDERLQSDTDYFASGEWHAGAKKFLGSRFTASYDGLMAALYDKKSTISKKLRNEYLKQIHFWRRVEAGEATAPEYIHWGENPEDFKHRIPNPNSMGERIYAEQKAEFWDRVTKGEASEQDFVEFNEVMTLSYRTRYLNPDGSPKKKVESKQPPIIQAEAFITKKYPEARRNMVTKKIEFCPKNLKINGDFVAVEMARVRINVPTNLYRQLLGSIDIPEYNPIMEYFDTLKFDGIGHIEKLANHVLVQDHLRSFFNIMLEKHLVRAIRQLYESIPNRYMFVLFSQAQSNGKSTFLRFLNPFGNKFYTEHINTEKPHLSFCNNFIINNEELESLKRTRLEKQKGWISQASFTYRPLYANHEEEARRIATMFGSTNSDELLVEHHNSRWLIFKILGFNFAYNNILTKKSTININAIWAEAMHLYKNEKDCELTPEEINMQIINNKSYHDLTSEDILVREYLKTNEDARVQPINITRYLMQEDMGGSAARLIKPYLIGKALAKAGFKYTKRGGSKRWLAEGANGDNINDIISHFSPEQIEIKLPF